MNRHLDQIIIGGVWVDPHSDDRFNVIDPSTEERVISVPAADGVDVDRALTTATAALRAGDWANASMMERTAIVRRAADVVESRAADIGRIMTEEMGAPLAGTVGGHVSASAATMRELADYAEAIEFRTIRVGRGPDALVTRGPVGVVAAITPWNGPFATAVNKAVAALLMGNPVVCKPSPQTPLDIFHLADALTDAGLPEGLLSILPAGAEASRDLVADERVHAITFTGSTPVGREIGRVAGSRFARVQLELGGKSAALVLDDADPSTVAGVLRGGTFRNAGQVCTALTRILVPRSRHDEFVDAFVAQAEAIAVGDPYDPATEMGPLAFQAHYERVQTAIANGVREGARIVTGGSRPAHLDRGYYLSPTILVDVHRSMTIAQEEIFGPVAVVIPHDGDDDAVAIANDSAYGLHGAAFTADPLRALAISEHVHSGVFSINGCTNPPTAPFGGVKASGIGREHDFEGLYFFSELKSTNLTPELSASLQASGTPLRKQAVA